VSTASAASGGGRTQAQPGKKSPVTIGTVGAYSGLVGASQAPDLAAIRAWIRYINDKGGLNGHPVNPLIVADDGGDSARNRQLVQKLIEQDKVVALIFDVALDGSGAVSYVTQQGVPYVGGAGIGQYFYESPVFFPATPQGLVNAETSQAVVPVLAKQGKSKLATIVCVESPKVCNAQANVLKRSASQYGGQVVYAATASITAPDYSAECLNARNAGAQAIFMVMDGPSMQRIAASCARQGYRPQFATIASVTTSDLPKDDNLQGMVVSAPFMPVSAQQPALNEFFATMKKYAPGESLLDGDVNAWAAAKVLELGGKNLPDGDLGTLRKALLNGLWSIPRGTDLGFAAPLQFNPNQPATPVVCWFIETVKDHKWVSDGKRTCVAHDPKLTA
jgi:branched-chain amino acid transport system substrate-binding protein